MNSHNLAGSILFLLIIFSAHTAFSQWTSTNLSAPRMDLGGVAVGSKALFAGGMVTPASPRSNQVDIYDYITNTWTTASLSQARTGLSRSATANGSKAFFAGGSTDGGGVSNVVDIYDVQTNTWTTSQLSQARRDVAAASLNDLVFFAGGMTTNNVDPRSATVDIYNVLTQTWTAASLSVARHGITAASAGGKVFFAGGRDHTGSIYYNTVDIFDYASSTWSTTTLSQGRSNIAVAVSGNKIFFGGGSHSGASNVVDIYDGNTNSWSTATLSAARNGLVAGAAGTKVLFAGGSEPSGNGTPGNRVDIYDVVTNSWTTTTMPTGRAVMASASVGGKIIFAGGMIYDGSSVVDIYTVCTPPVVSGGADIEICPNGSTTLSATGASNYEWSPTIGLSASTQASVEASPSVTTMYQVIGKTADLCSASDFVNVTVAASTTVSPEASTICQGTSTTLTALGADTYTWSPSTGLSATHGGSVTASPLQTTTYTVTGGLANCETSAEVTITVAQPVVGVTESVSLCQGESKPVQATGAVSYSWSPSIGLSTTTGANVVAAPTETTTYTVTGTDASNCHDTHEVTVTVKPLPNVNINPVESVCSGTPATLTATGANSYTWAPADHLSSINSAVTIATPTATRTYTVTGTDLNGCSKTSEVVVTVKPVPLIAASQPVSICIGQSTTLTATGGITYAWSPSGTLSSSTGNSVVASPLESTVYTVTGTATNGCEKNTSVSVTVITIDKPSITGTEEAGWILSSSNPAGNLWFRNGVQIAGAISQSILVNSDGRYQVQVVKNGCMSELSDEFNLVVTSLEEKSLADKMQLYPNPSSRFIYLSENTFLADMAVTVVIKDALGRPVAEQEIFNNEEHRIDVSNLPRGNYFLLAVQGNRIITRKFIRE